MDLSDPTTFVRVYDRHARSVYGTALRILGDAARAQDVTQDVFLIVMRDASRYEPGRSTVSAWLCGIARTLVRHYHKHNRIETAARERLGLPLAFAECEDYERVDERITAHAMGPALKLAMRALPQDQRRALELRVIEQLDYEEVAGRLGCSQNAARLRVSRGLRALTLSIRGAEA